MRLLHAVLLSVVIVLALNVGLPQARALGDDETDVSAGDVHPSRETAIDEESRSLFPPSFTAKFKGLFGKSSSSSKTASQATKVQAAQRVDDTANLDPKGPTVDEIVGRWKNEKDIGVIFKNSDEYLKLSQALDQRNRFRRRNEQVTGADVLILKFRNDELKKIVAVARKHTQADGQNFGKFLLDDMLKAWVKKETPKEKLPVSFQEPYQLYLNKIQERAKARKRGPIDENNLF